ncbi:glycosyltransferase family 9 protein [Pseudonocardia lacus]|uniref:glycosyltransferase family 9 protein n=1 Tax=Pseudonocardia lacus TaxID=2835865 RepID=UPI001BDC2A89|nr:glycosyltransferase family 9 protein [Pseudonocardia lacus]
MALVLRALGLGDLLVAVPALRALRRARPEHRIVLATPAALGPLAALTGAVDAVQPTAAISDLRRPPDGPPDLAVNLHGAGPQSHAALDATGPAARIGFGGPPGWPGPTHAQALAADPHERELWCGLLERHGIPADPLDLRLDPPSRSDPAVVVHPGAAFGAKRWPVDRFAAVAAALDGPVPVVVTGSAAERERAERTAAAAGLPAARVLAGRTTLTELCALVAGARLVVSGDTGIAHLAAAVGTPSVVLFGPTGPRRWGPPPGPHRVIEHPELRRGDPFADDPDPALLAVRVDEVLDAVMALPR